MSRRARAVLVAVIVVATVTAIAGWRWQRHVSERAAQLAELNAAVQWRIDQARDGAKLPGISAAFALPDGRVGTAVAGFADVEAEVAMTPDHRFPAGSVGKTFHAALAVALAHEGVIDLDAPISRWIGDEPWFDRLPNARELTLRHLLQHRSGLIDHVFSLEFLARTLKLRFAEDQDALLTPEQLIEIALDREPLFPAGEGYAYGDTNYVLAGLVVERATGRSPFEQIEERFLEPLELETIAPAWSRQIPGLAAGYQMPLNLFLLPPKIVDAGALRFHPMIESTAGGFVTTPRDVVRWAQALFEARALPQESVDELVDHSVSSGDGRRYGLGVFVYDTPLGTAWGHGGYFPGYRSGFLYFPDSHIAVCVQVNRDFAVDVDALLLDIARDVLREIGRKEGDSQGRPTRSEPQASEGRRG